MFLDVHSLLEHKKRNLSKADSIVSYYRLWKHLRKEFGDNDEIEAFVAGYTLGNNVILRDKFIDEKFAARQIDNKIDRTMYDLTH